MFVLKTLYKAGANLVTNPDLPRYNVLEKQKDFEVRTYFRNKYLIVRLDDETESGHTKVKDSIITFIWKLIKYTQGDNLDNLTMKFYMPVFLKVTKEDESEEKNSDKRKMQIMITLPPEYQSADEETSITAAPKPNDGLVKVKEVNEFKSFVRTFSGFGTDSSFKKEIGKLISSLENSRYKYNYDKNSVICIIYDSPLKLFNRRNEVMIMAE